MRALTRKAVNGILGLVVPPVCAACREPDFSGEPLCPSCRRRLVALADPRCRRCGAPAATDLSACEECRGRRLSFERAWAPFAYEGVCRAVVGALKSRGAVPLARLMAAEIAGRAPPELTATTLVPVPAHPGRLRRHGFNQAEAIAAALARRTGATVADVLARASAAPAQVGGDRRRRLVNVRGSVRLGRPAPPGPLVLVDDVYTTGATLDACAGALRAGGASHVSAVTFARALKKHW